MAATKTDNFLPGGSRKASCRSKLGWHRCPSVKQVIPKKICISEWKLQEYSTIKWKILYSTYLTLGELWSMQKWRRTKTPKRQWTGKSSGSSFSPHSFQPTDNGGRSALQQLNFSIKAHSFKMKNLPTQLSQRLQCEALGGRKILQVKQYLSLTVCPLICISLVRGGGRYVGEFALLGTSAI